MKIDLTPWILAARLKTLPASIMPVILGSCLAYEAASFDLLVALKCLAFAILAQIGANYANDYYDFLKGADSGNDRIGPTRMVASGRMKPETMRWSFMVVLALAFIVGLTLLPEDGWWWILLLGSVAIVTAVLYTASSMSLAYLGLGDLAVILFFGFMATCLTFYLQVGYISTESLWVALGIGLLTNNILLANNYRDYEKDRSVNKKTLVVRFGRSFGQAQYAVSCGIAYAVPVVLMFYGFSSTLLLTLLGVPMVWFLINKISKESLSVKDHIYMLESSAKHVIIYALLMSLGILLA